MAFNPRKLNETEIKVEIANVNRGGVKLLLWKGPFAVAHVLNEAVGATRWKYSYSDDLRRCTLSIYDDTIKEWVSRDGVGDKPGIKGLALDALSHAASQFGIGEELYTAPEIFFSKTDLRGYIDENKAESGKPACTDCFKVLEIKYRDDGSIDMVTIGVSDYENRKPYIKKTFMGATGGTDRKESSAPAKKKTSFEDSDVLQIGLLKGKTYGAVKNTHEFKKLVEWAKGANKTYPNREQEEQFQLLKTLNL